MKIKEIEFNFMSVKDLASNMLDAMFGQPEIDVVQTTSHGEVLANLGPMQGLEVMAKVAGNIRRWDMLTIF